MLNLIVVQVIVNHPCLHSGPTIIPENGLQLVHFYGLHLSNMQCRKRTTPWRQAKSLEDVVNTATRKIDLRSPCCLLRSGKPAIFVNQGAICLRQFLFCHLFFLTHTCRHTNIDPRRGPCHRRSAAVQNSVMTDRLEIKVLGGDIVQNSSFLFCFGFFCSITAKENSTRRSRYWKTTLKKQFCLSILKSENIRLFQWNKEVQLKEKKKRNYCHS